MEVREALMLQAPSLELQRAAQVLVAQLDARIQELTIEKEALRRENERLKNIKPNERKEG